MFTGLIECTGVIREIGQDGDVRDILIDGVPFAAELGIGDSIAVSGVCLTVARITSHGFVVEMMPETYSNTVLGSVAPGYRVNLERSLRSAGRFEGHIVTGHVDVVGKVKNVSMQGRTSLFTIDMDPLKSRYAVRKGSVAIQGVSLTVIEAGRGWLKTGLIPKTLETTTLKDLRAGSPVNIEFDIVAKYIEGLLAGNSGEPGEPLTMDFLEKIGWA